MSSRHLRLLAGLSFGLAQSGPTRTTDPLARIYNERYRNVVVYGS